MALKRKYGGTAYRHAKARRTTATPPKALKRKTVRRNYRASYKLSKPFKQVLNKFLDSKSETHWVTKDIFAQLVLPRPKSEPSGPNGLWSLIPSITQAGQAIGPGTVMPNNISSREGSKVRMKSATLNLTLRMDPAWGFDDPNCTAIRYKVLLLSCKKTSSYDEMLQGWFGQDGFQSSQFKRGSTPVIWDKYMETFDHPVNTELFTVHDMKTGTLTHGLAKGDTSGSAVRMPTSIHNLKLKIACKSKILRYETPASEVPSNFAPFLWIGWKSYTGADWISPIATPGLVHCVGAFRMSYDDME